MSAAKKIRVALLAALLGGGLGGVALYLLKRHPAPAPVPSATPVIEYRTSNAFVAAEVVLDGKLTKGWEDWGWGPHEFPGGGPAQIVFSDYGGLLLHHEELPSHFGALSFRYLAPESFGSFLEVSLEYRQVDDTVLPSVPVEPRYVALLPGGWSEVLLPWSVLNPNSSRFDRIQIRAKRLVASDKIPVDKIVLTDPSASGVVAATNPVRRARLAIDCKAPTVRIDPLVYGIANDSWETGATASRIGGNTMTRLNWDLGNTWNTGSDWYFENVSVPLGLPSWIADHLEHGVKTALVVPMIGWVAKDATSVGFPRARYGAQRAHDPKRSEAGDGFSPAGVELAPGNPGVTSVAAPPELVERWITRLREQDRARGARGVDQYILDNEPSLWNKTHRDVHPGPVGYDELLDRTIRYGTAIRKADPDAVIAGPAEWGWSGYFYSAKDLEEGAFVHADRLKHGNVPLLPWYLQKLAEHERHTGVRILDVVDVHFYPQVPGVYGDRAGTDPETSARRLRSTRALWDETYKDESWIAERVNLIPRVKEWIRENYPGRGISIGEWSFGAEEHVSGALAITEALGRFGQQGIRSAFYWRGPPAGTPGFFAFRAYRNYDGRGAHFSNNSLQTRDASDVSLFASRDDSGRRLTAVVLNLDPVSAADVEIELGGCGEVTSRRSFAFRSSPPGLAEEPGRALAPTPIVEQRVAPYSFTVIELTILQPRLP